MLTNASFAIRSRVNLTTLATTAWLVWVLCWMALAWSQHSIFQILTSLGVATVLDTAATGAVWFVGLGCTAAAMVLTTLGWLSFALYWMSFAWSRYMLLQNGAIPTVSLLACSAGVCAVATGTMGCRLLDGSGHNVRRGN